MCTNSVSIDAVPHAVAGLNLNEVGIDQPLLARFGADQRQRQPRSDDRRLGKLAQKIRNAADVIFVAVRHQHARAACFAARERR